MEIQKSFVGWGGVVTGFPSPSMSCSVFQCFIKISAAYGSTKDISVYSVLGLLPSQIFIVGRPTKKYQTQCQVGWGWGSGSGGQGKSKREQVFIPLFALSFICSFCLETGPVLGAGESSQWCHVIQPSREMETCADNDSAVWQEP